MPVPFWAAMASVAIPIPIPVPVWMSASSMRHRKIPSLAIISMSFLRIREAPSVTAIAVAIVSVRCATLVVWPPRVRISRWIGHVCLTKPSAGSKEVLRPGLEQSRLAVSSTTCRDVPPRAIVGKAVLHGKPREGQEQSSTMDPGRQMVEKARYM
jgi:hypothetical protein